MEVSQPPRRRWKRVALIAIYMIAAAWTFRGVLAGHRVQGYTFEQALALVKQDHSDPSAACFALQERIVEAIGVLRGAGPHGAIAIEAIHNETR